jgi:collagen type I/II/III/V/XI/XXIV/XXVII alpha
LFKRVDVKDIIIKSDGMSPMAVVTVRGGAAGPTIYSIDFPDPTTTGPASIEAAAISAQPSSTVQVVLASGVQTITGGATSVVVNPASGVTTLIGVSGQAETVLAGSGGLVYTALADSTVVAAGGANVIKTSLGTSSIVTGTGNDFITLLGSGTVSAGAGANTVFGSSSAGTSALVMSTGAGDYIDAGAGTTTVMASGSASTIKGGSGSLVVNDTGFSNTILGGVGAETIFGGAAESVFAANTPLMFLSGVNSSSTIAGGAGGATLFGSAGGAIAYLASAGTAVLVGTATGSDTLNASGSSAGAEFFLKSSADIAIGGSGSDTIIAGTGSATMVGGAGSDRFIFVNGSAGGSDVIADFGSGDVVILSGYGANEAASALANKTNTFVTLSDNTKITFSGGTAGLNSSNFVSLACFRAGTAIGTPNGDMAVETLLEGDLVTTVSGEARRVRWIGTRMVDFARHPAGPQARPICVKAHAFGFRLPQRDLWLSPEHAVFVDDVLIPIRHLVNGTTIASDESLTRIMYFHVELETHDVLLAEGLPAESWLDTGNRHMFANAPITALAFDETRGASQAWSGRAYAELVESGPVLEEARRRIGVGTVLDVEFDRVGEHHVTVPAGTTMIRLMSQTGFSAGDVRRLGIAIRHLLLNDEMLEWRDRRLKSGFHAAEPSLCWTDGAGLIAPDLLPYPVQMIVDVATLAPSVAHRRAS